MRKVYLQRIVKNDLGYPVVYKSKIHYQKKDRSLYCGRRYHAGGQRKIDTYENVNCPCCLERLEWQTWDWGKYDAQLAKEHKLTRERIRQIRVMLRKPKHTYWDESRERLKAALQTWDWTRTDKEIALAQGVSVARVYYLRRVFHKPKVKSRLGRNPSKWTDAKLDALFADTNGNTKEIASRHGMHYNAYFAYKKMYDARKH